MERIYSKDVSIDEFKVETKQFNILSKAESTVLASDRLNFTIEKKMFRVKFRYNIDLSIPFHHVAISQRFVELKNEREIYNVGRNSRSRTIRWIDKSRLTRRLWKDFIREPRPFN